MKSFGIGVIGTGYMGKAHALAFRQAFAAFGSEIPEPRLEMLCDADPVRAEQRARECGFARWTGDWRALIVDPAVDVVSITTPNAMHRDMAIAAAEAGKHVYCEKPLALTLADAEAMAAAVRKAGVGSLAGYNYIKNPAVLHAKRLIEAGRIGRVIQFRGVCDEDYMADESLPYTWRCRIADAGSGTLGDLAVHLISVARFLVGEVASVSADIATVHVDRPDPTRPGETGRVENEDQANALIRFAGGQMGTLLSSRAAWGRKNHLAFEIHGSKGMITFDQERMNELRLFEATDPAAEQGFKTILSGPAHPPYDRFMPSAGHSLGFNEMKTVEVAHLLGGLAGNHPLYPDFEEALKIEHIVHAILASAKSGGWQRLSG